MRGNSADSVAHGATVMCVHGTSAFCGLVHSKEDGAAAALALLILANWFI